MLNLVNFSIYYFSKKQTKYVENDKTESKQNKDKEIQAYRKRNKDNF